MKKAMHNKDGSLKHSQDCNMLFGRKDPECPRCAEMIAGAPARSGWQKDYYNKKNESKSSRCTCGASKEFGICTCGT